MIRAAALVSMVLAAAQACAAETILDTSSFCRQYFTWRTPVVRLPDGQLGPPPARNGRCPCGKKWPEVETPAPPAGWTDPGFDDSGWSRLPADMGMPRMGWAKLKRPWGGWGQIPYLGAEYLAMLCVRARFDVTDPSVTNMKLTLSYHGGVVVYVNGRELTRAHVPKGTLSPETLAEEYPGEAHQGDQKTRAKARARALDNVAIPPSLLRKGVNVLAVEVHRSPSAEFCFRSGRKQKLAMWPTAAVTGLRLEAEGGAEPNVARPKGVRIWNHSPIVSVLDMDYGDPCEGLHPIRLVGTRNGRFSGLVVVGSDGPLSGVGATIGSLAHGGGKGSIPASRVRIRYGLADGTESQASARHGSIHASRIRRLDVLSDVPPPKVAVAAKKLDRRRAKNKDLLPVFGAVVPVWVTVTVPEDAAPGGYAGRLSVKAGGSSFAVPVELEVSPWKLPGRNEGFMHATLIQSPESVAMRYKVDLWSDRHLELVGRSLKLIGEAGCKVVFVPVLARTNLGNEQGMVRWIKRGNGYDHDYGILDRYLDVVEKNMGRPRFVVFVIWEISSVEKARYRGGRGNAPGKGAYVTLLDPATGTLSVMEGPRYSAPECEAFWRPVLAGIHQRMKKRGWADSMVLGHGRDNNITKETAEMLRRILPDARWVITSHYPNSEYNPGLKKAKDFFLPVAYQENIYIPGGFSLPQTQPPIPHSPECSRAEAWKIPARVILPRSFLQSTSVLARYRIIEEGSLVLGRRGFGRVGADFWPVLGSKSIDGRFPSSHTRRTAIGCKSVLAPGPEGPLGTARLEMIGEGMQEAEAHVFVARALGESKTALGGRLAARARGLLDGRIRLFRFLEDVHYGTLEWLPGSGWEKRSKDLYDTAAEVATRLTGK